MFARELAETPAGRWETTASGSVESVLAFVDDDAEVAEMVAEAFELSRERPARDRVWSRRGPAGVVVTAHGDSWTLVARQGGPILLLADGYAQPLRLEHDVSWELELTGAVEALVAAAEGRDPLAGLAEAPAPPAVPGRSAARRSSSGDASPGTD